MHNHNLNLNWQFDAISLNNQNDINSQNIIHTYILVWGFYYRVNYTVQNLKKLKTTQHFKTNLAWT